VYSVSDGILWDVDYDDEHLYLGRSPEEAQVLRKLTGINENYYLSIAEYLKDEEIESKRAEVRKSCHSVVKA